MHCKFKPICIVFTNTVNITKLLALERNVIAASLAIAARTVSLLAFPLLPVHQSPIQRLSFRRK